MQYRKLGNTDVNVSLICLGTMTWGRQNTEAEAHEQMDYALSCGVNFFDTAEMYPIPPQKESQGLTETYIGNWFAARKNRDKVILATKVVGPGEFMRYIRNGPRLNKQHIEQAVTDSLKRLQTDYIDIYQLHWPERRTNNFGQMGYTPQEDSHSIPIAETLHVLADLVKSGQVRYIGISNETPWGMLEFLRQAEQASLPRIVSIQNPYNLLNRTFEIGLAEISWREKAGLLAYSPMAFGALSGKYLGGATPPNARLTLYKKRYGRYINEIATQATQAYVSIAQRHEINPAQMALAFVNQQSFLTSNIIGATTLEQLQSNIASTNLSLSLEIIKEIGKVHQQYPNPSP